MRIFHAPLLFAILFSFITISVSAEISERWEEPPLQKIRELFPLRKQTCGNLIRNEAQPSSATATQAPAGPHF